MLVLRIVLVLVLVAPAGCVAAAALPPSRTDVSPMVVARGGGVEHALRLAAGFHWASATHSREETMDLGVGAIHERGPAPASVTKAAAPTPEPVERVGVYVELTRRVGLHRSTRTWLGGRGELLYSPDGRLDAMGFTGRLSWELFAPAVGAGAASDPKAFLLYAAFGTIGIGSHIDVGLRRDVDGEIALLALAGVSLRLPAFAVFGAASK